MAVTRVSDCLERMILPALLSGHCLSIRFINTPLRVARRNFHLMNPGFRNDYNNYLWRSDLTENRIGSLMTMPISVPLFTSAS
jgi:hypothetical protein